MRLTGIITRSDKDLQPGVSGVARVDRRVDRLLPRLGRGDIAVLDRIDLDLRTADALVEAGVAAVVNASPSISGRFPNLGPQALLAAGVPLVDGVGAELLRTLKDGTRVRVHEGVVYAGDRELARGTRQTRESVADLMADAKAGLSAQLEAFSANTIEFLRRERSLVLEGVGVPELDVAMRDREVLVVAPGHGYREELARLRRYVRENRPVLIGVEEGAEALRAAGLTPDVVIGDPNRFDAETLRCGAEVVVPAQLTGHAPGLERIQDLGVGAVTFPASGAPQDLALLLADQHGASLVVTVGFPGTLPEFLEQGRSGATPCAFLTRLRLGGKIVDARAVAALHRARVPVTAVVLLVLAVVAVVAVALFVSGLGGMYADLLSGTWNDVVTWTRELLP
ncbi:putative membrane-anchored protein [Streptoalloteichus tenebrarius]|uniref:Membrane-anchored protein n=1 Tax=Streptoalloteichus tenebrarius (strain ATCC 17920 / DSM 40477 / JCM 4838 / CBS 697.72 / NBRC 16177 / NCIMB 11028 / NRRL B-12390 / A12253. 1 / ISP 5477) TaxID=1933 RepID=A0ABT1I0K7_STRSD|nr:putative cytokinetic ring protein SteA [Streptoalloteichus tenebrarius]MCP2261278.1 putative membrane-anchored protein [Streptoalloteichus tenebrarius]BFF03675.1 putative cytokinetic ring protein SteA [Streptoalloteichus tenebrarius]